MKYKANYFNDIIIMLSVFILGMYLGSLIPLLIYEKESILKISMIALISLVSVNIILNLVNVIVQIFLPSQAQLNLCDFKVKDKSYGYNEIKFISLEFGNYSKYNSTSSVLMLYRKNKDKISITNPSMLMCMKMKKMCKKAGYRCNYKNKIFGMFLLMMFVSLCITIISLLSK